MKQILQIVQEQFWCMGINLAPKGYGIVKNDFHNVPKVMYGTGQAYKNPALTNPPQYWTEQK